MVWQPVLEKEIFVFQPGVLSLNINLVSYLTHGGGIGLKSYLF